MNVTPANASAVSSLGTQASASGSAAGNGAGAAAVSAQPADSAPVNLSKGLIALGNASQDIDMAKVAQIRAALANGTLNISADRIASGLLNDAAALLG